MRTIVVVQARLGSTRLPGKTLLPLAGRSMLAHVMARAHAIPGVDQWVLTTPPQDLVAFRPILQGTSWRWVFDERRDILRGFWLAAAMTGADVIIRLTADCPLLAPEVAAQALRDFHALGADYVGTTQPILAYPDGCDVEVIRRAALERAHAEATDPAHREHVTVYLWSQPQHFRVHAMPEYPDPWARALKLSVDMPEDFARVRGILERVPPGDFSLAATLRAARDGEEA